MGLFRIYVSGESSVVGVIVAKNKDVANAFAQGKYGAGSTAKRVLFKDALEAGDVCEVMETTVRHVADRSCRVVV